MGDLDIQIQSFREQRAVAMKELVDYETGPRCFRDGVDVTDELIATAKKNVEIFEKLIANYEANDANRT